MEQNNELAHYGILGMKWGVRKEKYYANKAKKYINKLNKKSYDPKTHTLLANGKKSDVKKAEKYTNKLNKQIKANKKYKKAYRAKILSDPTKLYKHRKEFSKEEIDKAMSNFNREQKLRGYSRDKQSYDSSQSKLKKGIAIGTGIIATAELIKRGKEVTEYFVKKYDKYKFDQAYKQTSLF